MKKALLFNAALLWVCILFVQDSGAQDDNPLSLPDGAIARLGKGPIDGGDRGVAYSPDGTRLAVVSSLGIWLYDLGKVRRQPRVCHSQQRGVCQWQGAHQWP